MDSRKEKIKQELNLSDQEYDFLEKYQSMKLSQRFGDVFDRLKNDKSKAIYTHDGSIQYCGRNHNARFKRKPWY